MSIGRGMMLMPRINVYPTTTTITNISPPNGTATCKSLIAFTVEVDGYISPDGYVVIQDLFDGYTLPCTQLTSIAPGRSTATILAVLNNRPGEFVAFYSCPFVLQTVMDFDTSGNVLRAFGASQSPITPYNIELATSNISINLPQGSNFCYAQNFPVSATVTNNAGSPIPDGYVLFRIYGSIGTKIVDLPLSAVSSGIANSMLPANTVLPDGYFLQAIYLGDACFAESATPGGTAGTPITALRLATTTTSAPTRPASQSHCKSQYMIFFTTVSSALISNPSVGSVTFTATTPLSINLGSSYISSGVVPHTTTPSSGSQSLPASTINVASTTGFFASGTFYVVTSTVTQLITYTGITPTSFTGCTGGVAGTTINASADVSAFAAPPNTFPSSGTWTVMATYNSDGYCYAGSSSSAIGFDVSNC